MISFFNLEKLRGLLKDFYNISRIRITAFDENLSELVSYPEDVAPYCKVIRGTARGFEACAACDRSACEKAAKLHGPFVYRCHAGFTEAVTPLYVGEVLVGYLLFGHVFSYASHEEGWTAIRRLCADLPVNERMLKDAVFSAEPVDEAYVRSAAHILHAVASYSIIEHMATLKEDLLAVRLDSYLTAHYTEKLNAVQIAEHLGIGKTQLYALSQRLYGQGTAEHIRALRIGRAKELLEDRKGIPIAEIASRCGFRDYNYFFSVFRRETGRTPGEWRSGGAG